MHLLDIKLLDTEIASTMAIVLGVVFSFATAMLINLSMWQMPSLHVKVLENMAKSLKLMSRDCAILIAVSALSVIVLLFHSTKQLDISGGLSWAVLTYCIIYLTRIVIHGLTLREINSKAAIINAQALKDAEQERHFKTFDNQFKQAVPETYGETYQV